MVLVCLGVKKEGFPFTSVEWCLSPCATIAVPHVRSTRNVSLHVLLEGSGQFLQNANYRSCIDQLGAFCCVHMRKGETVIVGFSCREGEEPRYSALTICWQTSLAKQMEFRPILVDHLPAPDLCKDWRHRLIWVEPIF